MVTLVVEHAAVFISMSIVTCAEPRFVLDPVDPKTPTRPSPGMSHTIWVPGIEQVSTSSTFAGTYTLFVELNGWEEPAQ